MTLASPEPVEVYVTFPRVSFEHSKAGIGCDPIRTTWATVAPSLTAGELEELSARGRCVTANGTRVSIAA